MLLSTKKYTWQDTKHNQTMYSNLYIPISAKTEVRKTLSEFSRMCNVHVVVASWKNLGTLPAELRIQKK
jgi:hypothetical protein